MCRTSCSVIVGTSMSCCARVTLVRHRRDTSLGDRVPPLKFPNPSLTSGVVKAD